MSILDSIPNRKYLPKVDDIFLVKIKKTSDLGVNVNIIDYSNLEGFIPLNQLVKNLRKNKKVIRVGNVFPAIVTSTDNDTITLSKRYVSEEAGLAAENEKKIRYSLKVLGCTIYTLIKQYYNQNIITFNFTPEDVLNNTVWRVIDEFFVNKENNLLSQINKEDLDQLTENIDLNFFNIVLNNTNILFNNFISKDVIEYVNSELSNYITKTKMQGGCEITLKSLTTLKNIKEVLSPYSDKVKILFLTPGQYQFSLEDYEFNFIKTKLNEFLEELKVNCHSKNIFFKFNEYKVIKKGEIHFTPLKFEV